MNANTYKKRKEKGNLRLERRGPGVYEAVAKQFDGEDGSEMEPEIFPMNLESLKAQEKAIVEQVEDMQKGLDGLREMIADVEQLAADNNDDLEKLARKRKERGGQSAMRGGPR